MTGGGLLIVVGIWGLCQVLGGDALSRLAITQGGLRATPPSTGQAPAATKGFVPGPGASMPGQVF